MYKHFFLSFSLFPLFLISILFAQSNEYNVMSGGSTLMTMNGQTFIYEVNFRGTVYDFNIKIKDFSTKNGLSFDYAMTNANATKGTVSMTPEALQSARMQTNYFSGGPLKLTDMTTVWLSKDVGEELRTKGESKISTDAGKSWVVLKRKYFKHDFSVTFGDKVFDDFAYMYCESDDGSAKFWIQSHGNPIILKMDLGWTITLKEYAMAK